MANPALCEALNKVREWFVDIEINEEFFSTFFQGLKLLEFSSEAKIVACELVVKRIEKLI